MSSKRRAARTSVIASRASGGPRGGNLTVDDSLNKPRYIAYHEAGHAVSAIVLGFPLKSVDLKRRVLADGELSVGFTDTGKVNAEDVLGKGEEVVAPYLIQGAAGPFAERRIHPDAFKCGAARGDMEAIRKIACTAVCEPTWTLEGRMEITVDEQERNRDKIEALVNSSLALTTEFVNKHWPAIEKVAKQLLKRTSLTGREVAALVKSAN